MLIRMSEIEVYPQYLKEYLEYASVVGATSVKEDLVYAVKPSAGDNSKPLIERIESRHGRHTVDYAEQIGLGTRKYELKKLES